RSAMALFEKGELKVRRIQVKKTSSISTSSPPSPLLIVAPEVEGTYPVLQFLHGWCMLNTCYTDLLELISSHGFVCVAPGDQCDLTTIITCCGNDDVDSAAAVTDWLPSGLQPVLPDKVEPDFTKLALAGHSKGGKTAFALAVGLAETSLKFSCVIGIDPVGGSSVGNQPKPKILSYIPRSFGLTIPVAMIGTGLGSKKKGILPPFAPNGVNHAEFFLESKPPCCYFLAKDYGHADMLDDWMINLTSWVCKSGEGDKGLMRRGVAGIVVAFMRAFLQGDGEDLNAIVKSPGVAPIQLDPVIFVEA
ncbi:hypothetical protein RJ639_020647, partial [Escallonia herrerae]